MGLLERLFGARRSKTTWAFDQGPGVAAITTAAVLEGREPVRIVEHDADDHSWTFLCGTTSDPGDGRVVAMGQIVALDPTLVEVAELPPGWTATRSGAGAEWSRRADD